MSNNYKEFFFYKEETLTNIDCILYHFRPSPSLPIGINEEVKDLELLVEDFYYLPQVLSDLIERKILSLDSDYTEDEVLEKLAGKPLYFNKTLSKYFKIDLMQLSSGSEEVKYSNLVIKDYDFRELDYLSEHFPEFILNFGEDLEEKGTVCWVGDVGIFAGTFVPTFDARKSIAGHICSYVILENLLHVLEYFETDLLKKKISEHIEDALEGFQSGSGITITYSVSYANQVEGADAFKSKINNYREQLISNNAHDAHDKVYALFEKNIFKDQDIFFEVEIEVEHDAEMSESDLEFLKGQLSYIKRKHSTLYGKSMPHFANVWWLENDLTVYQKDSNNILITFQAVPEFIS